VANYLAKSQIIWQTIVCHMNIITCCLYIGSFDPFHVGHLEVVEQMLNYVDFVTILPNNPNKKKPNRTDLLHRVKMIRLTVDKLPKPIRDRIHVIEENCDDWINGLVDVKKVSCLGSDQYDPSKTNYHLIVDHMYIIPRVGYECAIGENKNVTHLNPNLFHNQTFSSTQIKQQIHGENRYDGLDPDVIQYVISHGLYGQDNVHPSTKTHQYKSFEQFIQSIDPNLIHQKINKSVIRLDDKYIKMFDKEQFVREIRSYEIAQSAHIPTAPIVHTYPHYAIAYKDMGQTAYDLITCANDMLVVRKIGTIIGTILNQLHHISCEKKIENASDIPRLRKMMSMMNIENDVDISVSMRLTMTHGDLNLKNIIVDMSQEKAYLIDIGKIVDSYVKDGDYLGISSYDYYQLISSMSFDHYAIDEDKAKILIQGIDHTYMTGFDKLAMMCKKYWELRKLTK